MKKTSVLAREGVRPLEYMERLGWTGDDVWFAHGIHFNDEELRVLAKTGTGVCHCPISNMKLSSGIARIPEMLELAFRRSRRRRLRLQRRHQSQEELRVAFLHHRLNSSKAAPSGYDVLKMATRGSARLLGRSDDIGTLEVGKCCDLFMIDSRRLELVGSCFDPTPRPRHGRRARTGGLHRGPGPRDRRARSSCHGGRGKARARRGSEVPRVSEPIIHAKKRPFHGRFLLYR